MIQLPYYALYEATHAAVAPLRALSEAGRTFLENPSNPFSRFPGARPAAAGLEMFERATRRYAKPSFGLLHTVVDGVVVPVKEAVVQRRPFCDLLRFERQSSACLGQPKLLVVAPMSGHYATLLRGTVEAFLPSHDVYITDWQDARMVPLASGDFDLDDYVDYLIGMIRHLGPDVHVLAVCQPSVPVIAAVARMEAEGDHRSPKSMILMGGPIDTRLGRTDVNRLAESRGTDWFRAHCIHTVPLPNPGFLRQVYPGFLQLGGFMAMNIDRHLEAHAEMFRNLVRGDEDGAEKQIDFYDEYLAVMDLTASFYLQTVDTVFVRHLLPKGAMTHRGAPVDLSAIRRCGLMTVEGEKDDISGVGQTQAAQTLCSGIPAKARSHYVQPGVGHYGVFNGSKFRAEIAPRISSFVAARERGR